MKKLLLFITLLLTSFSATADNSHTTPKITESWARSTPPGVTTSAIYMNLTNHSDSALTLVEVKSTTTDRIEIHNTTKKDGMMQMRQIDGVDIAKHTTVELKPHGMHLMLFDLETPLQEGSEISLELTFDNGKTMSVDVPVKKQVAEEGDSEMKSHKHKNH